MEGENLVEEVESESTLASIFSSVLWAAVVLVLFYVFQKFFTSSATPKGPAREKPVYKKVAPQDMDADTLSRYDGRHGLGICLCIKGTIFDVSTKPQFYGPNGSYSLFSGRDCSRALAKSSFESEDLENTGLSDLSPDETDTLNQWYDSFTSKYPVVGQLVSDRGVLTKSAKGSDEEEKKEEDDSSDKEEKEKKEDSSDKEEKEKKDDSSSSEKEDKDDSSDKEEKEKKDDSSSSEKEDKDDSSDEEEKKKKDGSSSDSSDEDN